MSNGRPPDGERSPLHHPPHTAGTDDGLAGIVTGALGTEPEGGPVARGEDEERERRQRDCEPASSHWPTPFGRPRGCLRRGATERTPAARVCRSSGVGARLTHLAADRASARGGEPSADTVGS